jgi:hypothetical protein
VCVGVWVGGGGDVGPTSDLSIWSYFNIYGDIPSFLAVFVRIGIYATQKASDCPILYSR